MSYNLVMSSNDEDDRGDLGLGRGYKPGGIPKSDSECDQYVSSGRFSCTSNSSKHVNDDGYFMNGGGLVDLTGPLPNAGRNGFLLKKTKNTSSNGHTAKQRRHIFRCSHTMARDIGEEVEDNSILRHSLTEAYPKYGDVVLGTSMAQQKRLFYEELKKLFPVCGSFDQTKGTWIYIVLIGHFKLPLPRLFLYKMLL